MNKLTATLAGMAAVAVASAVPTFAQSTTLGNFTANGPFVFALSPTTFSVNSISATFNPMMTGFAPETGLLSITGGTAVANSNEFTGSTLSFMPMNSATTVTQTVDAFVNPLGNGTDFISGFGLPTAFSGGFSFALQPGTPTGGAPVPEASTVLSFGALLALGGLAVLRRKTAVKTAA